MPKYLLTFTGSGKTPYEKAVEAKNTDDAFSIGYSMNMRYKGYDNLWVEEYPYDSAGIFGFEVEAEHKHFGRQYEYVFIKANNLEEATRYYNQHVKGKYFNHSKKIIPESEGWQKFGKIIRSYSAETDRFDFDATDKYIGGSTMARKFTKYPSNYISSAKSIAKRSFADLHKVLQEFDLDGRSAQAGHWSMNVGGYDLLWELKYDGELVYLCEAGELHPCTTYKVKLSDDDYANIQNIIIEEYPDVKPSQVTTGEYPRYSALLGFNTKQLWIYDEQEDVYIDPPTEVLDSLPSWNLVDGSEEAEKELARIANEENPDWLYDEDYWYDGDI